MQPRKWALHVLAQGLNQIQGRGCGRLPMEGVDLPDTVVACKEGIVWRVAALIPESSSVNEKPFQADHALEFVIAEAESVGGRIVPSTGTPSLAQLAI
ncbi:MAG TPA: hypothetical protein VHZ07_09795 [Bryobacteraceae bacterium]|nr:hypothetical protein [Bryobacteraceae bacterium]